MAHELRPTISPILPNLSELILNSPWFLEIDASDQYDIPIYPETRRVWSNRPEHLVTKLGNDIWLLSHDGYGWAIGQLAPSPASTHKLIFRRTSHPRKLRLEQALEQLPGIAMRRALS